MTLLKLAAAALLLALVDIGTASAQTLEDTRRLLLQQWHRNPIACLEALRDYSRNDTAGALSRLKRGQPAKTREIYDTALATLHDWFWYLLSTASDVTCDMGKASGEIDRQFSASPASVTNAANLILNAPDFMSLIGARFAAQEISNDLAAYVRNRGVTPLPASVAKAATYLRERLQAVPLAPGSKAADDLRRALQFAKQIEALPWPNLDQDETLTGIGQAAAILRLIAPEHFENTFSFDEGTLRRTDAAALAELLYPNRFRRGTMDLYRSCYAKARPQFFTYVRSKVYP